MDRQVIPVEHLTAFHTLPGHALRDPFFTMGHRGIAGKVQAWFNASSVVHRGKRWMAYRTECKKWFLWSRISIVQLDEYFVPIEGTNKLLPLHTRFDGWGAEDPRMFLFKGGMYISYGDGYRMLLAKLDADGNVIKSGGVPSNQEDLNPPQLHNREKNWGFFEFEGRLLCQHGVAPTTTLEFDPEKWVVINKWETPWRWISIFGPRLNGGAPPVFHDGRLWRWVHTHRTEKLPMPRMSWFGDKPQQTGHRYYPHLAAFKAEPPFEPILITEGPVFNTDWEPPSNTDIPTHYSVAYVGSSERDGDGWRIVYGENDCRIATAYVPDEELKFVDVAPPKPKKVRPASRNILHFIWLQGESNMSTEDKANVQNWRNTNPDWDVRVWDDTTLYEVFKNKVPQWFNFWFELCQLRANNPLDLALTAKASDMARLFLLSIRHSGEQQWNVYADTDTSPNRSLTSFLNDESLYGGNLPKTPQFNIQPSDTEWDSDNFDLIVSEENLQTPHRGYMTNAVMLSRPGAVAITAIVKAGIISRNRPTLKSWGPIMLRQSIEALKRTVDGRRIALMPYHYFVWNPEQMKQPIPDWNVCMHHNKFRWNQPGVKASNAGSGRRTTALM